MASKERDMRIPYRLGTNRFCKLEGRDEYVHMGDLVAAYSGTRNDNSLPYFGELCGVKYGEDRFIYGVTLFSFDRSYKYDVDCNGVFHHAEVVTDD